MPSSVLIHFPRPTDQTTVVLKTAEGDRDIEQEVRRSRFVRVRPRLSMNRKNRDNLK